MDMRVSPTGPDRRIAKAPLIAIVGCDGSGKSTVSEAVLAVAGRFGKAQAVHLGKQSGNVGRALARLPLFGNSVDKAIVRQTAKTRGVKGETNPELLAALVIYAFQIRRMRRFRRMLATWRTDTIIVADRFPQLDVPTAYDGPGMIADAPASPSVRWLAARERAQFEWMTRVRPDLVIRLNVDFETACARKPDHKPEALRRKIAATPQFRFGGAPIVEIDSNRPLADVLADAEAAVVRTLTAFGYAGDAGRASVHGADGGIERA
jgi:thymidylate kinase